MNASPDTRPWRKRHPIVSRLVLLGVGGAIAATLLILMKNDERDRRIVKLRAMVSSFDVLLILDSGPKKVLEQVEGQLQEPDLPVDLQVAARRYEAMALRRLIRVDEAPKGAQARVHAALEEAVGLAGDRLTRNALLLEQAEAYLEADDHKGARAALARGDFGREGPWAQMRDHYLAIAEASELGSDAGLKRLEAILAKWEAPLPLRPQVSAGGRTWNLPEIATVTAERIARLYAQRDRDQRPIWVRLGELTANDVDEQVICVKRLMAIGAEDDARRILAHALKLDEATTRAWAKDDPVLGPMVDSVN